MTLFERVFGGNDAVYGLTEAAIDSAIAQYGESQAVSFPDTAYSLPCPGPPAERRLYVRRGHCPVR